MNYACQVWTQALNPDSSRIFKLQKKAVLLLTFSKSQLSFSPLFSEQRILKIFDVVKLNYISLINKILNFKSPEELTKIISLGFYPEFHNTRGKSNGLLNKPQCKTTKYGLNSK